MVYAVPQLSHSPLSAMQLRPVSLVSAPISRPDDRLIGKAPSCHRRQQVRAPLLASNYEEASGGLVVRFLKTRLANIGKRSG